MRYLKKLARGLRDDSDVVTELFLAWIAAMLTALVVLSVLWYIVN